MNEPSYDLQPEHYIIAEQHGISRELLYKRVYYGLMDVDKACTTPVNTKCRSNGRWVKWKDKAVVSYATFNSRINFLGWDEKSAALTPPMSSSKRSVIARQSRKQKISEAEYMIAEMNGITRSCASYRVNQLKWDIDRAITQPVRKVQRRVAELA